MTKKSDRRGMYKKNEDMRILHVGMISTIGVIKSLSVDKHDFNSSLRCDSVLMSIKYVQQRLGWVQRR